MAEEVTFFSLFGSSCSFGLFLSQLEWHFTSSRFFPQRKTTYIIWTWPSDNHLDIYSISITISSYHIYLSIKIKRRSCFELFWIVLSSQYSSHWPIDVPPPSPHLEALAGSPEFVPAGPPAAPAALLLRLGQVRRLRRVGEVGEVVVGVVEAVVALAWDGEDSCGIGLHDGLHHGFSVNWWRSSLISLYFITIECILWQTLIHTTTILVALGRSDTVQRASSGTNLPKKHGYNPVASKYQYPSLGHQMISISIMIKFDCTDMYWFSPIFLSSLLPRSSQWLNCKAFNAQLDVPSWQSSEASKATLTSDGVCKPLMFFFLTRGFPLPISVPYRYCGHETIWIRDSALPCVQDHLSMSRHPLLSHTHPPTQPSDASSKKGLIQQLFTTIDRWWTGWETMRNVTINHSSITQITHQSLKSLVNHSNH